MHESQTFRRGHEQPGSVKWDKEKHQPEKSIGQMHWTKASDKSIEQMHRSVTGMIPRTLETGHETGHAPHEINLVRPAQASAQTDTQTQSQAFRETTAPAREMASVEAAANAAQGVVAFRRSASVRTELRANVEISAA